MDINTIITLDCYIIGSEASSIIAKKVLADPKRKAEKEKLILEILSMFDENEPDLSIISQRRKFIFLLWHLLSADLKSLRLLS